MLIAQGAKAVYCDPEREFALVRYAWLEPFLKEAEQEKQERLEEGLKEIRSKIEKILAGPCNNLDEAIESPNIPLIECARLTLNDLLKELLIKGASPNTRSIVWGSPLHACSANAPNVEGAELLLNYGADVNNSSSLCCFMPPISFAAESGHVDLVKLFLKREADPNLESLGSRANTPLMYALEGAKRNPQAAKIIIGWLLFYGASPYKCNKPAFAKATAGKPAIGDTPIAVAEKEQLPKFALLLASAQKNLRATLTMVLSRGQTPFNSELATLVAYYYYGYSEVK